LEVLRDAASLGGGFLGGRPVARGIVGTHSVGYDVSPEAFVVVVADGGGWGGAAGAWWAMVGVGG
jgi:hypothetical protein